ncbi:Serine/threonine-protein kinase PknD [compost metagenome]
MSAEIVGVGVACLASGHTSTWAGSGVHGNADGTGPSAQFYGPVRAAVDHAGNVYVADHYNHSIRKITPMGLVSTLAGSGAPGRADGLGSAASFDHPAGIAVDGDGNVYVADTKNNSIRKITPAGVVSTLAGAGTAGYADGPGLAALFDYPTGLALDGSRNLYVTDTFNHRIRKITPAGVVTTLAGSGTAGRADGPGSAASFHGPLGLAFDGSGNLYVVDRDSHSIRKITSAGVVSTLAGSETPGATNGTGSAASFHFPFDITADSDGNAYIADPRNNMIRKMTPAGVVTTLAGSTTSGRADGIGAAASFAEPAGITIDGNGILYVADHGNNLIRKLVP